MAVRKGHFGCLGETSTTPPFQRLVEVSSSPRLHLRLRLCYGLTTAVKTRIQRLNLVLSYGWKPHDI